jgi:hypothetical protein
VKGQANADRIALKLAEPTAAQMHRREATKKARKERAAKTPIDPQLRRQIELELVRQRAQAYGRSTIG